MVLALLISSSVAKPAPRTDVVCQDWEALTRAIREQEIAYEFDGHQIHVWLGRPQLGDHCTCGAWRWA